MQRSLRAPVLGLFLVALAACRGVETPESTPSTDSILRIGLGGFVSGSESLGIGAIVRNIVEERLVNFGRDGRAAPNLIARWEASPDRRTWQLHLRPGIRFHDGSPLTAGIVRDILQTQMPAYLGPAAHNVVEIRTESDDIVSVVLKEPSNFLIDALEIPVEQPGSAKAPIGTAAFALVERQQDSVLLKANPDFHDGPPLVSQIVITQYGSLRAAWAEMLRGQADMLYEIGVDAQDFLKPSTKTRVFASPRSYAHLVILNVKRPQFREASIRRALNTAIDRAALVSGPMKGHGMAADSPIWPFHWAYDAGQARFQYQPAPLPAAIEFTCLIGDNSQELLALDVQRMLQEIGVTMHLEIRSISELVNRMGSGDFDAVLADTAIGPTMLRPYQFWYPGGPGNYGGFAGKEVSAALEAIDSAADDPAYKVAVGALQRAVIDDPPAIFLTWGERARAVSTRFDVPVEPGRDILGTLRSWRPLAPPTVVSTN